MDNMFQYILCTSAMTTHFSQIHINKVGAPEEDPRFATKARKLMHRFTPEQVKAQMDEAEKE